MLYKCFFLIISLVCYTYLIICRMLNRKIVVYFKQCIPFEFETCWVFPVASLSGLSQILQELASYFLQLSYKLLWQLPIIILSHSQDYSVCMNVCMKYRISEKEFWHSRIILLICLLSYIRGIGTVSL